jgi:hypothetical protein
MAINLEVDRIFRHSTMRSPRIEWTSAYIKARILLSALTPPPRTPSPNDQNVSQIGYASQILRARGSPSTPKALNLLQVSDLVQNDGDIPPLARELIRDSIDFAEDQDTNAILARRELREKDVLLT